MNTVPALPRKTPRPELRASAARARGSGAQDDTTIAPRAPEAKREMSQHKALAARREQRNAEDTAFGADAKDAVATGGNNGLARPDAWCNANNSVSI